ncbi:hypothetical protein Pyn_33704 [Prunus yedoensis var. nudiflora]|uniref:Uncharacterized protein n=1 Tax=Prunus yedoensis var. nudiflora TaxID=2094558 RepID=A0A314XLN0_PRUYE|nr:hypothetical protein Pyn_33704 [Prunus yedoensis var. nudiflora]
MMVAILLGLMDSQMKVAVAVEVQFQELWRVREVKLKGGDERGRLKEKWLLGMKGLMGGEKKEEEEGWVVEIWVWI